MRSGLLPPAQCATLHQARPTPLRKADVDDIEVSRHDRLAEDRPRLARDLGPEVAIREVREGEHLHPSEPGKLGRAGRRGMKGLVGPILLLGRKGRLMDEEIGLSRDLQHLAARPCVAGDDDLSSRARRAEHLFGRHRAALRKPNRLARLQTSEERPLRDAELQRLVDVEAARPRLLDEAVPIRSDAVLHREGEDPVVGALDPLSRPELSQLDVVRQLPEDPAEDAEEVDEPRRAVDGQRSVATAERERFEHAGQTEVVVGVIVRQQDLVQLDEPHGRAQKLALRALAAVDEDPLAAAAQQRAC
jgi:hypothetical protein